MPPSIAALGHHAAKAKTGSVGIIFALCLIPIVGLVGIGIDLAFRQNAKTTLDAASNAAALAAVTMAQSRLAAGSSQDEAYAAGLASAKNIFAANTTKIAKRIGSPTTQIDISFDTKKMTIASSVGYGAQLSTTFGQIFGVKTMALARSAGRGDLATASIAMAKFMEVSFAIDNSQSMGIGATTDDINRLTALTGCAFGCHFNEGGPASNETIAHNNGIRLRIDAIKDAVKRIITSVKTDQASYSPKRESFGLYTLDGQKISDPSLVPVRALTPKPSSNYDQLLGMADNIDLAGYFDGPHGDTNVGAGLRQLVNTVGKSDDGSSAKKPRKFLFVMTDGVEDMPQPDLACRSSVTYDPTHCSAPFDRKNCDAYKANGVTVAVIYTTYLKVPFYDMFVQPFADEIVPNLKACASGPDWFAEASDAASIDKAIGQFYQLARTSAVLTQ